MADFTARCGTCGETFNPLHEKDIMHIERLGGEVCDGVGEIIAEWGDNPTSPPLVDQRSVDAGGLGRRTDVSPELRALVRVLRDKIQGLPDHPWIPGGRFKDGKLLAALEAAERALDR